MLRLEHIVKTYSVGPVKINVLKDITLEINNHELLSIMGPSGSGKSTLMNIMGLLDKPSGGLYFMDNLTITYDDDKFLSSTRNNRIGFVFQQYNLLPRLTAIENVELPLVYRRVGERERREKAAEYMKIMNIYDRAYHKPAEMSGGQQQRVAIARALVGNPSIILADEPTGALDTATGQELMNMFRRLNEKEGITIVIISHDPKIANQCNRVIKIEDGMIVQ